MQQLNSHIVQNTPISIIIFNHKDLSAISLGKKIRIFYFTTSLLMLLFNGFNELT